MIASNSLVIFLHSVGWRDLVDIGVVALLLYQLLKLIRGTQAVQLLVGIGVLFLLGFLAEQLHLRLLKFIFSNGSQAILIAAVVLFQPELRRALDQVGRLSPVRAFLGGSGSLEVGRTVQESIRAAITLSEQRTGALVVFERETGLENVAGTGVRINGRVTGELLAALFYPRSPLHDGAVLIRQGSLVAAGCVLPLAETLPGVGRMGTRHRAALGLTLQSDAVVLIVSEESGLISIAQGGKIFRGLDENKLFTTLTTALGGSESGRTGISRPLVRAGGTVRALTRR
ncbi:MAG: diadenylate cyclase CdaA [Candidatus Dormibacteria bacterium]